jgi:hypothetical protein
MKFLLLILFFIFYSEKTNAACKCMCVDGEMEPIIDNKINKIEKGFSEVIRSNLRKQRIKIKGSNYLSLLTFMNQR